MPHLIFLEPLHAASNFPEQSALRGVVLPDSAAVRSEVAAMLDDAERPVPHRAQQRPARRLRIWFPRWVGWLRAMPIP